MGDFKRKKVFVTQKQVLVTHWRTYKRVGLSRLCSATFGVWSNFMRFWQPRANFAILSNVRAQYRLRAHIKHEKVNDFIEKKIFFLINVSNYCEERKIVKLLINFYIKISRNLGSNFLDFWQYFSNFLAFQWVTFQHFTSTIRKGLQAGVDATPLWGLITLNGSLCTIELWMYLENYYNDWKNPLLAIF